MRIPEVWGKISKRRAQRDFWQQNRRSWKRKIGVWSADLGFSPHFRNLKTEVCGKFRKPRAHRPFHAKKPQVEALTYPGVVDKSGICRILSDSTFLEARTLGETVDFALCDQGLNPAELTAILSNALEMKQFESGMPRVICGMSGDELAREIIARAGLKPAECREIYPFDRSPQYWAGWVLAYTQWTSSLCFSDLFEVAPIDWIIGSYHPLHEAPEDKFAGIVIEKWNKAQADKKGLKAARKAAGLTQKQLATQSGVKLRAIQLYEQNQLDLRRASVSSALALANNLNCAIEDLVWQPIALEYDSRSI